MSDKFTFRDLFNKIDLYGLTFPLRFKKQNSYNTLCGITLSLITILGMTIVILYFTIKNFKRTDLSIITNTKHLYGKHLFNFTKNPFLVGYVNNEGRAVEIDPSYLTITLDKNDHYPEKNEKGVIDVRRESIPIKLEYCRIGIHFNDSLIKEMITEFEYENYLCPVPGQNLSIGGRWGDSVHGYDMLEFHLVKCENTSEKQNCKSEEELDKFFKNSYMSIIYLAQSLDHFDVENPIERKFRSEIFLIVTQLVKRYYYYFIPGEYISDNGFLFSNIKYYDFFEFDRVVIDFVDKEDQDYYSGATLAEVAFSSMDKFMTYERKYSKIQDSLGNIGGWIRIILTVCQFISDYFSEKIFLVDIINTISNVKKFEVNKKKISSNYTFKKDNFLNENNSNMRINLSPKIMNYIPKENIKVNNSEMTNIKVELSKLNERDKTIINFSLFEYFIPICYMERNKKYSFFKFYKDFIYKDISIEVIVPLVERLIRNNLSTENEDNKTEYLSKMRSSLLNTINGRNKKLFNN